MSKNSLISLSADQYDRFDDFAEMIVSSEAYDYASQGSKKSNLSKHDVILKLMKGYELGLDMFTSLTGLYNEHGRLTLQVDVMMALVRASGQLEFYDEKRSKKQCVIRARRKGDKGPIQEFAYTFADAKSMGLTSSFNYKNQPDVMLYKRCASKMARTLFPDIISGIYVEGELTDGTSDEEEWDESPTLEETADEIYEDDSFEGDYDEDIDDDEEVEDEIEEEVEEDEDAIFKEMIKKHNLDVSITEWGDGLSAFAEWCINELDIDEDDDVEYYIIEKLESLNFPIFTFIDEYDDEVAILPWSPSLDEAYKKALKADKAIDQVGFQDEEAEIELPDDEEIEDEEEFEDEIEDIIEELEEDDDELEEEDDDEEEMSWEEWDEDEWEEVE